MMSDIRHYPPAYCPTCGIFPAIGTIAIAPGASVSLGGVGTNCPTCGGNARLISGTYKAFESRLNVILDPTLSPDIRQAIADLIRKVQANETSLEKAKEEAEKLTPKAGRFFDISDWPIDARVALFGAGLMAVATLVAPRLLPEASKTEVHIHNTINVSDGPSLKERLQTSTRIAASPPLPTANPKRKK